MNAPVDSVRTTPVAVEILQNLICQEDGTTAVEYAVMLALILAVIIGSVSSFGSQEGQGWNMITTSLTAHGVGS